MAFWVLPAGHAVQLSVLALPKYPAGHVEQLVLPLMLYCPVGHDGQSSSVLPKELMNVPGAQASQVALMSLEE